VIPAATTFARATDVDHALALLAEQGGTAIAGGQSLVPAMKLRVARPSLVVDISRLALRGVTEHDGAVHIGALTTWSELLAADVLAGSGLAAVGECALSIGDLQIRNLGTIGGSTVHSHPASDMPAVLIALGATVRLRSLEGEREVDMSDFLVGPFVSALAPGELLTEIVVPLPPPGCGSAYEAVEHPASGYALAGAAALVTPDGESVAVTGIGGKPFALPSGDIRAGIAEARIHGDRFASEEYRRELAGIVAERALARARTRAEAGR
jgi:aerobic carbon-monoxide dehydrogenase medium subunit